MLLNIPVVADLHFIEQKRQQLIQKNLERANRGRIRHYDYAIGNQVLKLIYQPKKLEPRTEGPFSITRVHVNGSVTIQKTPLTTERLNIRRVRPYFNRN